MYDHILVERIHIVALVAVDLYSELVVESVLVVDHTLERVLVVKKLCVLTLVYRYSIHSELELLLVVAHSIAGSLAAGPTVNYSEL